MSECIITNTDADIKMVELINGLIERMNQLEQAIVNLRIIIDEQSKINYDQLSDRIEKLEKEMSELGVPRFTLHDYHELKGLMVSIKEKIK